MKSKPISWFLLSVFSLSLLIFSPACKKSSTTTTNTNMYTISGTASGANEVPAVTTSGTGTLSGTFDASTNLISYTVTWSNLSGPATLAHFHGPAAPGTNAGVVVPFTLPNPAGASGTLSGTATLTDAQKTDMLAGNWYFNVHTQAHGGGEIRGQVIATR